MDPTPIPDSFGPRELAAEITGTSPYYFTPIRDEAGLRKAIGGVYWAEWERFGSSFPDLTASFPEAKTRLLHIVRNPQEPINTHSSAMCALSKIGGADALSALVEVAGNPQFDRSVRYYAGGWIACIKGVKAVTALESLIFSDSADFVKRGALHGLENWASPEAEANRVIARVLQAIETDTTLRQALLIDDRDIPLTLR